MASGSTSLFNNMQCDPLSSLSQLKSKQTPFGRGDVPFGNERGPFQDEFDLNELKTVAAKDRKLREAIRLSEAKRRAEAWMKAFLQEEAENVRRGSKVNSDDDYTTQSEGDEDMVPVVLPPAFNRKIDLMRIESRSFIHKLWLRRISLTPKEGNDGHDSSLEHFELAIHNAEENISREKYFIYKEFYNEHKFQMIPVNAEALEKAFSRVLEEKEKSGFEMIHEDVVRFMSPTVRLCALLGLKLDFLDRLETIYQKITSIIVRSVTGSLSFYKTTAGLSAQRRKLLSSWNCLIPSVLTL